MPDHKYIKREQINGKYRYWYEEPGGSAKLPKKEPAKSTEPVLSTKKVDAKSPMRAYKTEDGRTVYAPAKTTKSIANKTVSDVKKELDAKKSEPQVSDEYKKELEYNSKKNSFTNEKTEEKKITESTKKKVEPASPNVSDEYKQELEYNSKKNSFTNEKTEEKKITEPTKKKVEPASPNISDEYKQELEYNSKKNSFTNDSTPAEAKQWLEDQWAKQAAQAEKKYRDGLSEVDKFLGEEKKYDLSKAKRAVDNAEWEYKQAKDMAELSHEQWEKASEAARKELDRVNWDRNKADPKILENSDAWSGIKNDNFDKMLEAKNTLREAEKALKEAEKKYNWTPMGITDKVSDLADKAADTIEDGAIAVEMLFKRLKQKLS